MAGRAGGVAAGGVVGGVYPARGVDCGVSHAANAHTGGSGGASQAGTSGTSAGAVRRRGDCGTAVARGEAGTRGCCSGCCRWMGPPWAG